MESVGVFLIRLKEVSKMKRMRMRMVLGGP
jgi:hypothetical protein